MDDVARIAGTVSAIVAALTLASGFYFYRRRNIDEYASRFNSDMVLVRTRFAQMRQMILRYDFQDEIAAAVVNNPRYDGLFRRLYRINRRSADTDNWNEYVEKYFSQAKITASVRSPGIQPYEDRLNDLAELAARYKVQYPGLFWLLWAVHRVFGAAFIFFKRIARDEDTWVSVLKEMGGQTYSSASEVRSIFIYNLWTELAGQKMQFRQDVDQLFEALDLVSQAYSQMPASQLYRHRFQHVQAELQRQPAIDEKPVIAPTLQQTRIVFERVLTPADLVTYERLVTGIQVREEEREKERSR